MAVTAQPSSLRTVTGTCVPSDRNRRVIPTFCVMTPVRTLRSLQLDFDVHTGSQVELHQSIDCLRRGLDDVEQTLMRPDFELFAALLVDMRRAVHGETLDAGRQRDRTSDLGAGALGRVDDFPRRIVENSMIEGFEPDADILTLHRINSFDPGRLLNDLCDDAGADG